MPINVITGLPGDGKTLLMMQRLDEAVRDNEKAAKHPDTMTVRPIWVCGVKGLKDGPWQTFEDGAKWSECPDNSLIFIDEAWKWFGHQHTAVGAKVPPHALALAEHRHRGIDFVWTTQGPGQIYPFVRNLIAEHTHVVRRFKTPVCALYTWGELQEDVKSQAVRARGLKTTWTQPKKHFDDYKSATLHTVKPKIPMRVFAMPVLFLIGAVLIYFAYNWLKPSAASERQTAAILGKPSEQGQGGATASSGAQGGKASKPSLRDTDPAAWLKPRIYGQPWTAPAYDDVPAAPPPRLACMAGPDKCTCLTIDQGTRYMLDEGTCRTYAVMGYYDPTYQAESREGGRDRFQSSPMPSQPVGMAAAASAPLRAAGWAPKPIRDPYTQPQAIPDYPGGL